MSKQSADPTFSPLLLLVPLPFVLATCLPLEIDHAPAPRKCSRWQGPRPQRASASPSSPPGRHRNPRRRRSGPVIRAEGARHRGALESRRGDRTT